MAKPPLIDDDDPLGLLVGIKNFCQNCNKEIKEEYKLCYECLQKELAKK